MWICWWVGGWVGYVCGMCAGMWVGWLIGWFLLTISGGHAHVNGIHLKLLKSALLHLKTARTGEGERG